MGISRKAPPRLGATKVMTPDGACQAFIAKGGNIAKAFGAMARAKKAGAGYRLGGTEFPFPSDIDGGVVVVSSGGMVTVASNWLNGSAGHDTLSRKMMRADIIPARDAASCICAPTSNSGARGVIVATFPAGPTADKIKAIASSSYRFKIKDNS